MARARPLALLALACLPAALTAQPPPTVELAEAGSVLAVVTHKAGFASGFAHDHLVVASGFRADLAFSPERPEATAFSVEVPLADLVVDDPGLQERWFPDIEALGVLDEPFGRPSEDDRQKIRRAMLGPEQLDVEEYPTLRASLLEVTPGGATVGSVEHDLRLTVEITLHGTTRRETFTGRMIRDAPGWRLEALGTIRTSDYGIEPYSAMLGAVKNEDRVHVLVSLAVGG